MELNIVIKSPLTFYRYISLVGIDLTRKEKELLVLLYKANKEGLTTESRDEAFMLSNYSTKPVMNNVIKSIRDKGWIVNKIEFNGIVKSFDPEIESVNFKFQKNEE